MRLVWDRTLGSDGVRLGGGTLRTPGGSMEAATRVLATLGRAAAVVAPHRGNSLRVWLGLAVAASAFYLVRFLIDEQADRVIKLFIGLGFIVCLFGAVSYFLYPFGFPVGVGLNPDTHAPSAYATLWEP